jgi:hypothetical protein
MSTNQQQYDRKTKSNEQQFEEPVADDKQMITKEKLLLRGQYRNADNTNETGSSYFYGENDRSEPLQAPILSKLLQALIRSELSPKKSESNEDHAGDMESQLDTQAHSMMMIQSGGSMANSGMKKKSIRRAKESLGLPISQKKSNKPIPIQQQKSMNNDDDDDNNGELGEEVRA